MLSCGKLYRANAYANKASYKSGFSCLSCERQMPLRSLCTFSGYSRRVMRRVYWQTADVERVMDVHSLIETFSNTPPQVDRYTCKNGRARALHIPSFIYFNYVLRIDKIFLSNALHLLNVFLCRRDHCFYQLFLMASDIQTYCCPVDLSRRLWGQIAFVRRAGCIFENDQRSDKNKPKPGKKKPEPQPDRQKPKPGRKGSREPREPRGPNAKGLHSFGFV